MGQKGGERRGWREGRGTKEDGRVDSKKRREGEKDKGREVRGGKIYMML